MLQVFYKVRPHFIESGVFFIVVKPDKIPAVWACCEDCFNKFVHRILLLFSENRAIGLQNFVKKFGKFWEVQIFQEHGVKWVQ